MKYKTLYISLIIAISLMSFNRPDDEYRIFQFPHDMIPGIDGKFEDWNMVPESYTIGISELKNTRFGEGQKPDSTDFNLEVKVGWVKGLNRLYFYIDAYDDFWDFDDPGLRQDIFELVVDGNCSGGEFIDQKNWEFATRKMDQPFFEGDGTHAQNYHIFIPARNKDWAMPWGNYPWIKEFPHANSACRYNFSQGEKGRLQMEFYITPFDFASFEGPENSVESNLIENQNIGISWAMLDFDGKTCEAFMNLSNEFKMISNASYLRKFRLMPLEDSFKKAINANWKYSYKNKEKYIVNFFDYSEGEINKWHWDFGDGTTSDEQNPVHQYAQNGIWTIVLTVEGAAGTSSRSKVWEVVTEKNIGTKKLF